MQNLIGFILAQEQSDTIRPDLPPYILVLGILILIAFLLISAHRRVRRSKERAGLPVQERIQPDSQGRDVCNQIGELMAKLAELSRQINGQMDMRLTQMDLLLHQADQKIESLQHLTKGQPNYKNPTVPKLTPSLDSASPAVECKPQPLSEKEKNQDPIVDEVLRLKSKGMSSVAIAQQLERPVGEIELMLAIRRKTGFSGQ